MGTWDGTRDRSPFLALKEAIEFREWVGGEAAILKYAGDLSRNGADYLVKLWGTGMLAPHSMQALMHNVIVPTNSSAACEHVRPFLKDKYGIFLFSLSVENVACYLRVHAQIYLDMSDYERLGQGVIEALKDFNGETTQNSISI